MLFSWRRFRERVTGVLHLDESPSRLAASIAVGVFIGTTPFFFLHTLLAVLVALLFRLNMAATITGAWINLPWFAPFVYAFCLKLGEAVLSGDVRLAWSFGELAEAAGAFLQTSAREHAGNFVQMFWDALFVASKPLFVGTTLVGGVAGIATYFIALGAIREINHLRRLAHPVAKAPGDRKPSPGEPRL
ncbi:MAG TPA: DUF2062 domain-containing protein [Methylomirabilota bacterium]|nr:DUF2062 domain-containing protein [Methylomirabilota bacterium]